MIFNLFLQGLALKQQVAQFLNDHGILQPILQLLLLIDQIDLQAVDLAFNRFAPIHLLRLLCRDAVVLLAARFAVSCTFLILTLAPTP